MSASPSDTQTESLGDRPILAREQDELGHGAFAERVAADVMRSAADECVVFAVNAPWGMGKSSVLNLLAFTLANLPGPSRPTVVRFDPWWHSGEEGLARGFFEQLLTGIAPETEEFQGLRNNIRDLAELLYLVPEPSIKMLSRAVAWLTGQSHPDLLSLKEKIRASLLKRGGRAVVLIDEIDRLTRGEIALLFRLVKAVADFPGVTYVLAFDREHVAQELTDEVTSGSSFLDKIVQVQHDLPPPVPDRLRRMLTKRLDKIIRDVPESEFDRQRWVKVHFEGISKLIRSPRDVVRVTNALRMSFPRVAGEVDPVDFIALEVLRIKQPHVYAVVREGADKFVGSSERSLLKQDARTTEEVKDFHNSWLAGVDEADRTSVKALVSAMFPRLESVWGNTVSAGEADWLKRRRICSAQVFPVYFRLETPDGEFSRTEMKQILSKMASQGDFASTLRELVGRKHPSGTTMAKKLLLEVQNYTEKDIPLDSISTAVAALFDVGDELLVPEDESQGIFDFGSDLHIGRVTWQLIRRLDEADRFSILESAFKNGTALTMICREVRTLASQHEKSDKGKEQKPQDTIVSPEHLEILKLAVLNRIREAVKRDGLKTVRDIRVVLPTWNWLAGGVDEGVAWVRGVASDVHGLAWLLKNLATFTRSQAAGEYLPKKRLRLNPKSLEPAMPRESIVDSIRVIATAEWATQDEKAAAAEYLREYRMLANGEDPDSPRAFDFDE